MTIPNDRRYTESHEWVKIDGDNAIVGITDHAQDALGDITFVELPEVDLDVEKGGESGVVESVKAASDLYSPIAGTVSEVNEDLENEPEKLNSSPYEEGWIFKLSSFSEDDYNSLMDAEAYKSYIESAE